MKDLEIISKNIKNKEFSPIYFFHGEEPYYIDLAVKLLENGILTEEEKAFNQMIVYGKDSSYAEILSLADQYPMIGDYQVIIVKEAQDLKLNEEEQDIFLRYIENPVPSTILVFAHKQKKIDSRKRFAKALEHAKMLHYSEPVKDYNLSKWIQQECASLDVKTAPNIPSLLAEYLGNDLSRIANELQKLKLILKENEILDEKLIERHIGISKEYNVFELQKALGTKNSSTAFKIVYYMGKNPKTNPLKDFAEAAKFYPLKHATRAISILREFDLKGKGLGTNQTEENELLKEMVYKLLNIDKINI